MRGPGRIGGLATAVAPAPATSILLVAIVLAVAGCSTPAAAPGDTGRASVPVPFTLPVPEPEPEPASEHPTDSPARAPTPSGSTGYAATSAPGGHGPRGAAAPHRTAPSTTPPSTTPPGTTLPSTTGASTAPSPVTAATTGAAPTVTDQTTATTVTHRFTPATGAAPFRSSIGRIDDALAHRMRTSYHDGCPVPLSELRYLRMSYWGFDGRPHTGEMVVSARVARDVVTAFRSLYAQRFPIRQMRLVDDFGGSDEASMAADNTSAFNCRPVTGGGGWSEHSYGEAVDINPVQNPYLSGSTVLPPAGRAYLDRPDKPGVIRPGGVAVRAFAAIGWTWGGTWTSPVDLQHFSLSGR